MPVHEHLNVGHRDNKKSLLNQIILSGILSLIGVL